MEPTDARIAHLPQKKFFSETEPVVECAEVTFQGGDKSLLYVLGVAPYRGGGYDLKHSRHKREQQRASGDMVGAALETIVAYRVLERL